MSSPQELVQQYDVVLTELREIHQQECQSQLTQKILTLHDMSLFQALEQLRSEGSSIPNSLYLPLLCYYAKNSNFGQIQRNLQEIWKNFDENSEEISRNFSISAKDQESIFEIPYKSHNFESVLKIFDSMSKYGLLSSVECYNMAMISASNLERPKISKSIFGEIFKLNLPTVPTKSIQIMMTILGIHDKPKEAMEILDRFDDTSSTFRGNFVQAQQENPENLLKSFLKIREKSKTNFISALAIRAYVQVGQFEEALKLYHQVAETRNIPSDIFVEILREFSQHGMLDLLFKLKPNLTDLNRLLESLSADGKFDSAREILRFMGTHGPTPNLISFALTSENFEDALFQLENILKNSSQDSEEFILKIIERCPDQKSARKLDEILTKSNFKLNEIFLEKLIDVYSQCDQLEKSEKLYAEAGQKSDGMHRAMLDSYGMYGYDAKVLRLVRQITRVDLPSDECVAAFLRACATSEMRGSAIAIFDEWRSRGFELNQKQMGDFEKIKEM
eukprot:TRINITY_DN7_c5_g1_i3.p1 TRINITY_DN7_c5_g1~~TRINITY_DN7_c5_g1_i3.p1  ORF type:complete len:569 (-),score=228.54 TRINITY_DN7_c5_g1_i3:28-1542(-)